MADREEPVSIGCITESATSPAAAPEIRSIDSCRICPLRKWWLDQRQTFGGKASRGRILSTAALPHLRQSQAPARDTGFQDREGGGEARLTLSLRSDPSGARRSGALVASAGPGGRHRRIGDLEQTEMSEMTFVEGKYMGKRDQGEVDALQNNAALETLIISGGWCGGECDDILPDCDDADMVRTLKNNIKKRHTDINIFFRKSRNSLDARGFRYIAEALKMNKKLTTLKMHKIVFGDAHAEIMAEVLVSNSSLTMLQLNGCGVGALGTTTIAVALKTNTSLEILDMSFNDIQNAGATALAEALASTTSLKKLILWGCVIGEQAARALGRAWGSNLTLVDLIQGYNFTTMRHESLRIRAEVLEVLRREQLLGFGMAMIQARRRRSRGAIEIIKLIRRNVRFPFHDRRHFQGGREGVLSRLRARAYPPQGGVGTYWR